MKVDTGDVLAIGAVVILIAFIFIATFKPGFPTPAQRVQQAERDLFEARKLYEVWEFEQRQKEVTK